MSYMHICDYICVMGQLGHVNYMYICELYDVHKMSGTPSVCGLYLVLGHMSYMVYLGKVGHLVYMGYIVYMEIYELYGVFG